MNVATTRPMLLWCAAVCCEMGCEVAGFCLEDQDEGAELASKLTSGKNLPELTR